MKKIKNNIIFNKFIPILLFFSLFLFIFLTPNVKALFTDDFPNMIYPDDIKPSTNNTDIQANLTRYVCNKVLVKYNGNDNYYIINFIRASYDKTKRLYLNSNNVVCMEDVLYMQCLKWNGSSWVYVCWSGFSGGNASNVNGEPSYASISTNSKVISSSTDIYKDNTFKEIFFQVTPQVEKIVLLTQVEEIPQTMNKVLQLIIPIGLKILLVGLIIFLIRWVILRVT